MEETAAVRRQAAEKELERGEEIYRAKSRSLAKTRKALAKAPESREKTEKKMQNRAKKNALKAQKQAETELKRAQKRYRKGKLSSEEFAKFQQDLQNAAEQAARTAGEEYVYAEAKLKRFLKRHHLERDVFDGLTLNVLFALVEVIGGLFTGSVAILVNAIRDLGDVFNIVFAYFFHKRGTEHRDENFTFGYSRHVVMAAFGTTAVVMLGATLMVVVGTMDLIYGNVVSAGGMIVLGVFGLIVNGLAIFRPRKRGTLRRRSGKKVTVWKRSLDLNIIDDCLGWTVVLVIGIVMAFTDWRALDAVAGIIMAVVIILKTFSNFRQLLDIFLEKAPESPSVDAVKTVVLQVPHVVRVSRIHVWHLDLETICVTLHVEVDDPAYAAAVKAAVRQNLRAIDANEITIEIEAPKQMTAAPSATGAAGAQS